MMISTDTYTHSSRAIDTIPCTIGECTTKLFETASKVHTSLRSQMMNLNMNNARLQAEDADETTNTQKEFKLLCQGNYLA